MGRINAASALFIIDDRQFKSAAEMIYITRRIKIIVKMIVIQAAASAEIKPFEIKAPH